MPKRPPDFSFEREGRPLSAWLRDLVSEDAPARLAAGEALQAMMYGLPSIHTDFAEIDWGPSDAIARQADRFKEAVRAAVRRPDFPTADFVRRLIAYRIGLKEDWHRRVDRASALEEAHAPFEQRLLGRLQEANDEAERVEATDRYLRWLGTSMSWACKRRQGVFAATELMTPSGHMARTVFDAMDDALLADRPGLRVMLQERAMFHDAAKALARIGPPAVDFAGFFLDRLDAQAEPQLFDGAYALGPIGREDPAVIDALLKRLRSGPMPVRTGAAEALGHAGPPLAGRLEVALDLLLNATHTPGLIPTAIEAMASVGRDREEALCRVLAVAASRPPRWRTDNFCPEYRFDEVMHERGVAIEALIHFQRFSDRAVPVLVDAYDSFEEYDPDRQYHGEHERVCWALKSFGPAAAPIIPRLVRDLAEWPSRPEMDRTWPSDILGLLTAIGPSAAPALPALEHLRATQAGEDEPRPSPLNPDAPLDRLILDLRRERQTPA